MKFSLAIFLSSLCLNLVYGQDEQCATILPDSAYAVSLPWYNNNQFLTDYLSDRGFYSGGLALRVPDPCPQARYQIPLRINIYRNTQGIGSITQAEASQLVDSVNLIFQNAGTSIQFYIDNISVFSNNFYSTGIQTVGNSLDLFHHNWRSGVVNVNFVSRSGGAVAGRGRASLPRYPELPFTNFSLFVRTQRNDNGDPLPFGEITSVFAHELGHTFGLLHTHHPGRLFSLATNSDNATINNGCYQEFQSRAAKNWTINGCLSTNDRRKCEINGDFLCDTEADPNVSAEWDGTTWLKQVRVNDCGYENPAFGNDYTEDNADDDWTPNTNNIMSYSRWQCRDFFSDHQIGIMWYYIEQEFQQYFDGQFSGDLVCTSGTNISFDNPPPNQTFRWFVSPSNMFHSTTQSGTGTTAFVKAKSTSSNGWGQVTFTNGTPGCGGMSFNYEFWVGAPSTPYIEPAVNSICAEEIWQFWAVTPNAKEPTNQYLYQWSFSGETPTIHYQSGNSNVIDISYCGTGYRTVSVSAVNSCGVSSAASLGFQTTFCAGAGPVPGANCGGGGPDGGDPGGGGDPGDLPNPGDPGCGGFICLTSLGGSVELYPIPGGEELTLDINYEAEKLASYERNKINAYDFEVEIKGLTASQRESLKIHISTKRTKFDISELPKGIYLFTITGHNTRYSRRFIKE